MSVTSGFSQRTIGELFDYTTPGDWGTNADTDNSIAVLRSTNFTNSGAIDYSNIVHRLVDAHRLSMRRVDHGTILIEKSGGSPSQPAGRVVYCEEDFGGTASNFIEIAKVKKELSAKYVFYLLYYLYQTGLVLKYQQQTTGIINFKLDQYKEEDVLLPESIEEQTQIAAILSTIDKAIAQTEAIIAKQQRIKTGLMQDLLTRGIDEAGNIRSEATHAFKDSPLGRIPVEWEVGGIMEFASKNRQAILTGPFGSNLGSGDFVAEGVPILRIGNVQAGYIDQSDLLYVTEGKAQSLSRYTVQSGDLLFARQGATTGRNSLASPDEEGFLFNYHIIRVAVDPTKCSPTFLYAAFNSEQVQNQVDREKGKGTREGVSTATLTAFILPIPSFEEQCHIAKVLDKQNDLIIRQKQALSKLKSQKQGLMQDLLTGNVRVTELLKSGATNAIDA